MSPKKTITKSTKGATPFERLMEAIRTEDVDTVRRLLLEGRIDLNQALHDGETPLGRAAIFGNATMARLLLLAGADPNAPTMVDDDEKSPLMVVGGGDSLEVTRLLLLAGADLHDKAGGHYALDKAVTSLEEDDEESGQLVTLLLNAGADTECRGALGWTPLITASRYGLPNIVRLLLARGANVQAKSSNGNSPLHIAAKSGHVEVVRLLLDAKARETAKNAEKQTAADIATGRAKAFFAKRQSNALVKAVSTQKHATGTIKKKRL